MTHSFGFVTKNPTLHTARTSKKEASRMKKPKRKYGMGGIYRPDGCKNYTIYYSRNHKRIGEATGSPNYQVAQQRLKRRVGEIAKGEFVGPEVERIRVSELWEPFR